MIATAAYTGPRRGELRGMYWETYSDDEMMIARSIWNGITTDPKSRKSKGAIPIIRQLAVKLDAHNARLGNPSSGPIFPNGKGKAIDPDSLATRVIRPAFDVCGVCSKPEAEQGKLTHKYERNSVLPRSGMVGTHSGED